MHPHQNFYHGRRIPGRRLPYPLTIKATRNYLVALSVRKEAYGAVVKLHVWFAVIRCPARSCTLLDIVPV